MLKLTLMTLSLLSIVVFPLPNFAQIRGENSSEFFREGQEQMNEQLEQMENRREAEEDNLEQTLEIKEPKQPEVEEVPDIDDELEQEGVGDNVPEDPDNEVEIKF